MSPTPLKSESPDCFAEPAFEPAVFAPPGHDGEALYFAFRGDRLLVRMAAGRPEVPRLASFAEARVERHAGPGEPGDGGPEPGESPGACPAEHYLGAIAEAHPGEHAGLACIAVDLPASAEAADGLVFEGLRQLFGLIDEELFAVAGRAFQVVEWDRTHRFCGRCGGATVHHERDRARQCPGCGLVSYPRVSPAVIVLVSRGDRFLLARNASFPGKRYSILAGFVEAGETLEAAVVREIREEVGIEVRDVTYFGSQPWPFPHSLMVGFTAQHASGEIAIDGEEIVDAGWYGTDPEQLPELPNRISISRRIIDSFLNAHGVHLP